MICNSHSIDYYSAASGRVLEQKEDDHVHDPIIIQVFLLSVSLYTSYLFLGMV